MILLQALTDSAVSANWFTGIAVAIVGVLLVRNLNRIEKILERHEVDINDIKREQAVQKAIQER